MSAPDPESILRRLPRSPEPPESAHLDDGVLVAWRGGALDDGRVAAVEGHLARCSACRALARELAEPASDLFLDRVRRIGRTGSAAPERPRWIRRATLAVPFLAAAGVLTAVFLLAHGPPPPGDAPVSGWRLEGPFGGLADARNKPERPSPIFTADSQIRLLLRPDSGSAGPGTQPVTVLLAHGLGPLRAVRGLRSETGPTGIRRLEGPAAAVLGPELGPATLVLVVGGPDASALDGLTLAAARSEWPAAQWLTVEVEYRPAAGAP